MRAVRTVTSPSQIGFERAKSPSAPRLASNVQNRANTPGVRFFDSRSSPSLPPNPNKTNNRLWEFGLGCNGVITLLLERLASPDAREALDWISAHLARNEPAVVAVVVRASETSGIQPGERLLWSSTEVHGKLAGSVRIREAAEGGG